MNHSLTLSDFISQALSNPHAHGQRDAAWNGLRPPEAEILKNAGWNIYHGKVRDVLMRGPELLMLHTDRLSAFDRHIALIPYKGVVLCALSQFWFQTLKGRVPTHFIDMPHPRVLRTKPTRPIKAEVVVRGYLAGSMLRAYETGVRLFCGVSLPDGLRPYGKLPQPIITPTSKAAAYVHDENITADEIIAQGIATKSEWQAITDIALKTFQAGSEIFAKAGWILADTKYECGVADDGTMLLIDEVHTPDSSRLWQLSDYASRVSRGDAPVMLDKENIRRYLLGLGFSGHGPVPEVPHSELLPLLKTYLNVYERLSGQVLSTHMQPMHEYLAGLV